MAFRDEDFVSRYAGWVGGEHDGITVNHIYGTKPVSCEDDSHPTHADAVRAAAGWVLDEYRGAPDVERQVQRLDHEAALRNGDTA